MMIQKTPFTDSLLAALLVTAVTAVSSSSALANPQGATVVSGAATITENGNKLDIHQTSNRALIDWRSFDIDAGEHTQFHQPSASAVAVNRISDINPSTIAGRLSANGRIVLINPNGMMFTDTAVVDVSSLLATTANIETATFESGKLEFNHPGMKDAQIVNHGLITSAEAGLVGLVAPHVENHGLIVAKLGTIKLASADTATLDFYGDDLLKVAVSDAALEKQLIKNTGKLSAEAGTVILTAAAARDVVDSLIQVDGEILAPVVEQQGGKIIIRNDTETGDIVASATIDASALDNGDGGEVILWAENSTDFTGDIKAEGGQQSGDGGFVEVSGKKFLNFRGKVSTLAPNGNIGTLLLDPTDILIDDLPDQNITGTSPYRPTVDDGPSVLDVDTLEAALASGNVVVQTIATGSQDGDITVAAPITWTANRSLSLTAHDEVYINAAISGRRGLTVTANDVHINAPITRSTGSGFNVALVPRANNISMGIAGGAGQFNVDTAELNQINILASTLTLGRTSSTAAINVGAHTWNQRNTTIRGRTGAMQINGVQNTGSNNLRLSSRNLNINADLIGSGTLTIDPGGSATMGIAGGTGALEVSTADLSHIVGGWNLISFGSSGSQQMTVNAYDWNDNVRFYTSTGLLNIQGTQTALNGNNIELRTRNLGINADLIGTGNLTIRPDSSQTMGVAGGAGTMQVTNADLAHIGSGWNLVTFGTSGTQRLQVGANTWNNNIQFATTTGALDILGTQNFGSNNATLTTRNLDLNADLIGTGTITIQPDGSRTMGIAGGAGQLQVTSADLARLTGGWSKYVMGRTNSSQIVQVGAHTWDADLELRSNSGAIQIIGDQELGANNLTFNTNGNPAINAAVNGSGILSVTPVSSNRSIGLAGSSGSVNLNDAELDRISDDWSKLVFGRDDSTSTLRSNDYTWRWDTEFKSGTGQIRFAQAQNFQNYDVTLRTNGNPRIDNVLTGTGNFAVIPQTTDRTIGLAGASGSINWSATELNRFADGWSSITFGRDDSTADITINNYTNWRDPFTFRTGGDININGGQAATGNGALTYAGDLTFAANRTFTTAGGDLAFNGTIDAAGFNLIADTGAGDISFDEIANLENLDVSGQNLTFNGNVTTANSILAEMTGTTTLNADLTANGVGNPLILSSAAFSNTAGSDALNAPNDRWLVYYNDPAGNPEGGLKPDFRTFEATYAANPPAGVTEVGNGFFYSTDVIPSFLQQQQVPNTVLQVSQIPTLQFKPMQEPIIRLKGEIFSYDTRLLPLLRETALRGQSPLQTITIRISPELENLLIDEG